MSRPALKTVTRLQGNNAALKDGSVVPVGYTLEFEEVPVLVQAFRRMVRTLEFDVCEMALTTYICAREHGVKFTALPVFLVRAFHHGAILHNTERPIADPRELERRRVGVGRGYTVTTGVWARAILAEEYGVDLSKVSWILSGDEHVAAYVPPPNVRPIDPGRTIEAELLAGELAAAINVSTKDPAIAPLIPNALEAGFAAYESRGHYPINHCVVVRDDVLAANPGLDVALFDAFVEAKAGYLRTLPSKPDAELDASDRLYRRIQDLGRDPLPYGIEPNRHVLETLMGHATEQRILERPVEPEALFAPGTRTRVG